MQSSMEPHRRTMYKVKRRNQRCLNMFGPPRPYRPTTSYRNDRSDYDFYRDGFYTRKFMDHSYLAGVPSPHLLISSVQRMRHTLPSMVSFRPSSTRVQHSRVYHSRNKGKSCQLLTIKRELSQIKSKIDSLLGHLEKIERQCSTVKVVSTNCKDIYPSLQNQTMDHMEEACGEITDRDDYTNNKRNDLLRHQ